MDMQWLVLKAQAGDREALDTLLTRMQGPLYRYLRAVLGDATLAEDVLQEVLFTIYRKLDWLRDPALFEAWAFRIASRAAFKKLKKTRRLNEEPLPEEVPIELPAENVDGLLDALPAHIDALSPASRAVLTLHYGQSMTLSDVADVLGISLGTVKSRLAYGLRCLRAAIKSS
jgi:RNA polymerase sigma-70 factor (ECF subfamily)